MGFFDKFNPFKKNDDPGFSFDPNAQPQDPNQNFGLGDHNFEPHNFEPPVSDPGSEAPEHSFNNDLFTPAPPSPGGQPLNDARMRMPLGESVRQSKYHTDRADDFSPDPLPAQKNPLQKDLELISSKLDYLKASIEAINQRLVNLEHLVKNEQQNKRW